MNQNEQACPTIETLRHFVSGHLEPPTLDQCESHIESCPNCHETLRGLGSSDTLTGYVGEAFVELNDSAISQNASDSEVVGDLISRLLNPTANMIAKANRLAPNTVGETEMLADRAAEVLRYVESEEEGLGRIGDYRLTRLIGAGSTGVVFHAIDESLKRSVALKVLRPSLGKVARDRFLAEAQSAASIDHPNVVTIYQVGCHDRLAYIAMQWLPGQTLEQKLLSDGGQLSESEGRFIAGQVADGLAAAHAVQVVHRDIKPANIWICEGSGDAKILDFGLARISDDDPGLTATGMLAGTPNFMSPEQTKGLELDGRSDLFSLGCVLYQAITGRLPFGATTVLATLQSVQNEEPKPPCELNSDISSDLSDLVMCTLEKIPGNRPESAQALVQLLRSERNQWTTPVSRYDSNRSREPNDTGSKAIKSSLPPTHRGSGWSSGWGRVATGLALVALFFTPLIFASDIIRIATDQGELVIKTDDPNVKLEITQDGKQVKVIDTTNSRSFNIESGNYVIQPTDNDDQGSIEITPKQLVMKRGQTTIVTVTRVRKSVKNLASSANMNFNTPESNFGSVSSPAGDNPNFTGPKVAVAGGGYKGNRSPSQPVYSGKPFSYWYQIALAERNPSEIHEAYEACIYLASTNPERAQLLELTRSLVRQHGSRTLSSDGDVDLHNLFQKAFSALSPETIVSFMKDEIEANEPKSIHICIWLLTQNWIYSLDVSSREEFTERLIQRSHELLQIAYLNRNKNKGMDAFVSSMNSFLSIQPKENILQQCPELKDFSRDLVLEEQNYSAVNLARSLNEGDSSYQKQIVDRILGSNSRPFDRSTLHSELVNYQPSPEFDLIGEYLLKLLDSQFDPETTKTELGEAIEFENNFYILNFNANGELGNNYLNATLSAGGFGGMGGGLSGGGAGNMADEGDESPKVVKGRIVAVRRVLSALCKLAGNFSDDFLANRLRPKVNFYLDYYSKNADPDSNSLAIKSDFEHLKDFIAKIEGYLEEDKKGDRPEQTMPIYRLSEHTKALNLFSPFVATDSYCGQPQQSNFGGMGGAGSFGGGGGGASGGGLF